MHADAHEALASIDRATALAHQRVVRLEAHQADLEALRVTGGSRDGAATATLTHSGALCDLALAPVLAGAPVERVREALLEANTAAQARLVVEVTALTAEAFGPGSETARAITDQYAALFSPRAPAATAATGDRAGVLR